MKNYVGLRNGEHRNIGPHGARPSDAICVLPKELVGKKFKLIDEPQLNPDDSPMLDMEGLPVTKKVAVLDEPAETQRLADKAQAESDREAIKVAAEALREELKAIKLNELTGNLNINELRDIVVKLMTFHDL